MPPGAALRLSVVLPMYNEEGNVALMAEELQSALDRAGIGDYEVIFVDDGSTDRSAANVRLEIARDRRVRLLRLARNCGETAAIEAGVRHARGDAVVVMDCDLQNDPADIPKMLARLGEFDCVCGYRPNRSEGDDAVRVVSSWIANGVRNLLAGDPMPLRDTGCTFRAFRRDCARKIKFYDGMHRFLPLLFRMEGFSVTEVPVNHRPRRFGESKYGILNRVFVAAADLLAVRWMRSRVVRWQVAEEA